MNYFFIGGAPKSGTTWIQRSLDLHPEIVCSGEGHFHELLLKPLFEMFKVYNKKLKTVSNVVYDNQPLYAQVSQDEVIAYTRRIMIDLMSRRRQSRTLAIGDKTPTYGFIISDLKILFPDLIFIMMVRDPRDVAASRLHHAARVFNKEALNPGSDLYRDVVKASAKAWSKMLLSAKNFQKSFPQNVIIVKYERLITDQKAELKTIFSALGATTRESILSNVVEKSSFEVLSGRKPGVEDRSSFFRKGIIGDWVSILNENACATVVEYCKDGMTDMGYEDF